MIVLRGTQDQFLSMLESVAGLVDRRHRTSGLANVLVRGNTISNDMPETGGDASVGVTDGPDVAATDDDDGGDSDGEPARRPRKELKNRTSKAGANSRKPLHSSTSDDAGNNMTNANSGNHRNATATAGAPTPTPQNPDIALWRLPTVLAHVPVSRSGWWQGVKTGRYPAPVKLSARCVAWRASDIYSLIASF